jgi:23S rRNA (uracil1939-C5)-methyltransferase
MTLSCRHHGTTSGCQGCPLLREPYEEQLRVKRERLVRALARYPHLGLPEVQPIVPAVRTESYRHRLKLPVHIGSGHGGDRSVSIGLYDSQHRVLHTPDCPVLAPALRETLPVLADWLSGRRGVHSVDLRVSEATGDLALVLACAGGELPGGPRAARELRRRLPKLASIAISRADPKGLRVMGSMPQVLAGAHFLEERIGETRYRLHPGAFFQVDPLQAVRIHDLVREMVGDAATVLDLYAGVGAYGLMLAKGRKRVVLIEEVEQAARGAAAVAPPHVEVLARKVESVPLQTLLGGGPRFDVAVINPARRGSDPASLERLGEVAERVVYVSCGPETLARDLDCLASHGLRADRVVPVDLFPQTREVEAVVHLSRGEALTRWRSERGWVRGPWQGQPSGATGRPSRVTALVIGQLRPRGKLDAASFEKIGTVATHSLIRLELKGSLGRALSELRSWGHPVAGEDPKTAPFFAEKAGLVRPFVHVDRDADGTTAPLHGDLAESLDKLGGITRGEPAPQERRSSRRPDKRRGRR